MLLLAFDTASPTVTVALHDGSAVVARQDREGAMRHGELLAPAIAAVLAAAEADRRDLTDVAVGVGPGPYTGLRVGIVTARTLAAALPVRVHGVCSLDVVAAARERFDGPLVVATDARRKEVYWARYDDAGHRVSGPAVDRPAELAERLPAGLPVVGRGAQLYSDLLHAVDGPLDPDAGVLAGLVVRDAVPTLAPEPLYLRRPDVRVPGAPKRVS